MTFTSDVLVGRTQIGQRQTVKEQGMLIVCNTLTGSFEVYSM